MSTVDTQVIVEGQRANAVVLQNGDMIYSGGTTDTKCIVNVNGTPQLAHKVALVGPGGAAKPEYVDVLPDEGEEGVLYMVNSGVTRDGYAIFQMFSWHEGEWVAIGAFDVGINPTGIVYEQSFDAATNTWNVTVSQ